MVAAADPQDLLHQVALLVHLDRVDPAVAAGVSVLKDGLLEGLGQRAHPGFEQVWKAQQQGHADATKLDVVAERLQIDPGSILAGGCDNQVAIVSDSKKLASPVGDAVELGAVLNAPTTHCHLGVRLARPSNVSLSRGKPHGRISLNGLLVDVFGCWSAQRALGFAQGLSWRSFT